ncbi:uncharacterized protein LOC143444221 isoform X2 [Clavelina lepadiformis]
MHRAAIANHIIVAAIFLDTDIVFLKLSISIPMKKTSSSTVTATEDFNFSKIWQISCKFAHMRKMLHSITSHGSHPTCVEIKHKKVCGNNVQQQRDGQIRQEM